MKRTYDLILKNSAKAVQGEYCLKIKRIKSMKVKMIMNLYIKQKGALKNCKILPKWEASPSKNCYWKPIDEICDKRTGI